ncbi:hypothetical protein Scep_006761 [Stephania cephalantha]|uniref:C6H2-type domain-containing protein n=1 Tax=Stephania cephalantha TaxID=152367 RepID=A0AAP0KA55_9MAGN
MDNASNEPKDSILSCAQCGKPAHLQCPKCVELKLSREGAAFCSQDCFKAAWTSHKSVHLKAKLSTAGVPDGSISASHKEGWLYCLKKGKSRTPTLPYFDWTGTLRPYPISGRRAVPDHIEKPDWAADGIPKIEPNSDLQNIVEIKTQEQIEKMRETCRIAREVLDAAARVIKPGVTTDEIDAVVHEATIAAGKRVVIILNRLLLFFITDQLMKSFAMEFQMPGDLNETYFVGNVDEASQQLVRCTYECLEKAISIVKPGVRFREVGEVINRHASMSGFSVRTYAAGVWRDRLWPDGWTAATADGKRSAQFEHTLLVTETGVEVLTARLPTSPKMFPWLNA